MLFAYSVYDNPLPKPGGVKFFFSKTFLLYKLNRHFCVSDADWPVVQIEVLTHSTAKSFSHPPTTDRLTKLFPLLPLWQHGLL